MARPQKNSCDYFTHDNDMRNHRKIKSIRNKFGIQGYAVWSMLLEYLTGIDGNEFEYSDLEFELISGDFGVSVTEIREVVDYCIKLEMLFINNGFVYSESLNNRLAPVYKKRGIAKEISEKQKRVKGKFTNKSVDTVVSVTETPQSKVNEIKVEEIKVNNTEFSNENLREQVSVQKLGLPVFEKKEEHPPVPPSPPLKSKYGDGELQALCKSYHEISEIKYSPEMYKEFLLYWTAIVTNGRLKKHNGKEKWRNEETFVLALRLSTWAKNNKKFENNNVNGNYQNNFSKNPLGATAVFSENKDYSGRLSVVS